MKTAIYKIFKALSLVALTLGLANCSKSDNNGSTTTVGTYQLVGNICYSNVNGTLTQVTTSLCTNSTSGYQWVNNLCYSNVNGTLTQVDTSYCNGTTTTSGYCNGFYSDGYSVAQCTEGASGIQYTQANTPWGYRQVLVMDCSGYRLYNTSNQVVSCQ